MRTGFRPVLGPRSLKSKTKQLLHRFTQCADARRDSKLARLGYRVLRLEAGLVLRHLPLALQRIREVLRGA